MANLKESGTKRLIEHIKAICEETVGASSLTDFDEKAAITELGLEPVTIWANGQELDTTNYAFHYYGTTENGNFLHCPANATGVYITNNTGNTIKFYIKCKAASNAYIQFGYGTTEGSLPNYQNTGAYRTSFSAIRGTGEWEIYTYSVPTGNNFFFACASGDIKWIGVKNLNIKATQDGNGNIITDTYLTKTEKAASATTADSADRVKLPRISKNASYQPGANRMVFEEFQNNSANLPNANWYHVLTGQGSDANYNTQLAIGMTTMEMYYRNRHNGTWGTWHKIPLLVDNTFSENFTVKGVFKVGSNTYGDKVQIWTDNEGGNIRITAPDNYKCYWEIDAFNGNLRIYKYDANTSTVYVPFSISDDTVNVDNLSVKGESEISGNLFANNMRVTKKTDSQATSFEIGGYVKDADKYPHLLFRQFSNGFQFFPNSNNNAVYIGHESYKFAWVYANNIYNSSGVITTSDRSQKHDIKDLESEFAEKIIDGLLAKSFKYNDGDSGRTHFGIIAQDLEELLDELGITSTDFAPLVKEWKDKEVEIGKDEDGKPIVELQKDYDAEPTYNVRYEEFIMILVKYCQDLKKKDTLLNGKMQELQQENEMLKNKLDDMEKRMEMLERKLS